jgi:hypothetical protein
MKHKDLGCLDPKVGSKEAPKASVTKSFGPQDSSLVFIELLCALCRWLSVMWQSVTCFLMVSVPLNLCHAWSITFLTVSVKKATMDVYFRQPFLLLQHLLICFSNMLLSKQEMEQKGERKREEKGR